MSKYFWENFKWYALRILGALLAMAAAIPLMALFFRYAHWCAKNILAPGL